MSTDVFYTGAKVVEKLLPLETETQTISKEGLFKPMGILTVSCTRWDVPSEIEQYFMVSTEYYAQTVQNYVHISPIFYPPSSGPVEIKFEIQKRRIEFFLEEWEQTTGKKWSNQTKKVRDLKGVIEVIDSIKSSEKVLT